MSGLLPREPTALGPGPLGSAPGSSPPGSGSVRRLRPAPAEVSAANLRDVLDLVRGLVDDYLADVEDGHVVGDPHRLLRRLLDEQNPETLGLQLPDDLQHLLDDDRGETCRW